MYVLDKEQEEIIFKAEVLEDAHVVKLTEPKETLERYVLNDNGDGVDIYLDDRDCIRLNYKEVEVLQILLKLSSANIDYVKILNDE